MPRPRCKRAAVAGCLRLATADCHRLGGHNGVIVTLEHNRDGGSFAICLASSGFSRSSGSWAHWSLAGSMSHRSCWSRSRGRCPHRYQASRCAGDGPRRLTAGVTRVLGLTRTCLRFGLGFGLAAVLLAGVVTFDAAAQYPASRDGEEPYTPVNRAVESSDLEPVLLPVDLWRGLDAAAAEKWLVSATAPRSPTLHQLWRRLLLSTATPPAGRDAGKAGDDLLQLRLQALYRSGLLSDIAEVLGKGGSADPTTRLWRARVDVYLGARDKGCRALAGPVEPQLPQPLKAEKQLLLGYCAAVAGNTAAAALSASLAREEGSTADLALAALAALDGGVGQRPPLPGRVSLLDYRFLELMGPVDAAQVLEKAEPALLVALAQSGALDVKVQVAAAEAALRLNAMTPEAVGAVYRRLPDAARRSGGSAVSDPILQRAQLFRAVEATQAAERRARLVRTLLSEARRAGLHLQTAHMLAPQFSQLWPSPETATLAEAVVETALAGGDLDLARRWAESAANLQHWLALIDLADSQARQVRQSGLAYLDELATRGRLGVASLHRVVTILDALDITVP